MSNTITITAATGEDMQALGERLAKLARGGDVLLLSGPLGAGKTTFAQGFGVGLGIGEPIVSPTFTIARELEGRFADGSPAHLVHVDAYRLGGNAYAPGQDTVGRLLDELESLGLDEELEDPGEHTVILMEWGEQMAAALAPERLEIHIDRPLDAPAVTADGGRCLGFVRFHRGKTLTLSKTHPTWPTAPHAVASSAGCTVVGSLAQGVFKHMQTLVIDTSYGSTVGVVGHEPIVETDSRTHVEKLQVNIAQAVEQAGLQASDITRIVVGVGPAPFTGLRAGIVAAKALAFATGAQLVGQDVLAPQCLAHTQATDDRRHLTLAVNDARRRQLYFALYDGGTVADGVGQSPITLIDMDIDYPDSITMRVNDVLTKLADTGKPYVVDVIGHGAVKYAQSWNAIASLGEVDDHALLDEGAEGLARFAAFTTSEQALAEPTPVEPLYLRRPDVSVPNPLKHVLNHAGAERTE